MQRSDILEQFGTGPLQVYVDVPNRVTIALRAVICLGRGTFRLGPGDVG